MGKEMKGRKTDQSMGDEGEDDEGERAEVEDMKGRICRRKEWKGKMMKGR